MYKNQTEKRRSEDKTLTTQELYRHRIKWPEKHFLWLLLSPLIGLVQIECYNGPTIASAVHQYILLILSSARKRH